MVANYMHLKIMLDFIIDYLGEGDCKMYILICNWF